MIVGIGFKHKSGNLHFPSFINIGDDHFFVYEDENGEIVSKIRKFNFSHWFAWIEGENFDDLMISDFVEDTIELSPKNMFKLESSLHRGCEEAQEAFSSIMNIYYEVLIEGSQYYNASGMTIEELSMSIRKGIDSGYSPECTIEIIEGCLVALMEHEVE